MTDTTDFSVLVCDDTAAKRYVIASWLRRDGYRVLEAETGRQALEVAAGGTVDLAILDVHLPDMNGLDVCAAIKADPRTSSTPVLHISAVAIATEDRSAGLDQGADAYMVDPIEPKEMLSTVRSLLRSSVARRDAERLATRLSRLASASLRINVALNSTRIAVATAEGLARILETESVALLIDDNDCVVGRTTADGVTTSMHLAPEVGTGLLEGLAGATVVHASDQPWSELLSSTYDGPWNVNPVRDAGAETVGLVLVPAHAEPTAEDRMLLHRLIQTAAVALGNLKVYVEEHRAALTLQRSLLPSGLPSLPGLVVEARYKASGEQVEVGGDFYDAFRTDDGRSIVVIGDVQGHSLEAAIVMAELRYSLRAFVLDGHPALDALSRLNRILLRSHPEMTATVCVLVFPDDDGDIEVANAGHIPPLVVRDGTATYLDPTGPLLGIETRQATAARIPRVSGSRIVLMTDGLVERRSTPIGPTLDRLAEEVQSSDLPADELCDRLMDRWGGGEDDVCVIVVDVVDSSPAG